MIGYDKSNYVVSAYGQSETSQSRLEVLFEALFEVLHLART